MYLVRIGLRELQRLKGHSSIVQPLLNLSDRRANFKKTVGPANYGHKGAYADSAASRSYVPARGNRSSLQRTVMKPAQISLRRLFQTQECRRHSRYSTSSALHLRSNIHNSGDLEPARRPEHDDAISDAEWELRTGTYS